MKIEKTLADTHATLVLKGEFGTDEAAQLLAAVDDLRARGACRIAASLRLVKYMNSTALGSLIRARRLLSSEGGEFVVVRPSAACREIMVKMGLDSVVPMFEDEASAVAHLTRRPGADSTFLPAGASEDVRTTAIFSFPDDRGRMLGERTHGVGILESVDGQAISFSWDAAGHGVDAAQIALLFATGSAIHAKFSVKLIRKDFFQGDAAVEGCQTRDDGTVLVRATWSTIREGDRAALAQFSEDMTYLKRQMSELGGAG